MPLPNPREIIKVMCSGWRKAHPEDANLPWQRVLFKVMRAAAINGGHCMFIQHSENFVISDFRLIDRKEFPTPFNG